RFIMILCTHRPMLGRWVIFTLSILRRAPSSTLFPYTTLFRSVRPSVHVGTNECADPLAEGVEMRGRLGHWSGVEDVAIRGPFGRSEEHTSELQSRENLVCRLLLEKKKNSVRLMKIL